MLSGPKSNCGFPRRQRGFTTLPPPSAIERKSGSDISTGMPKKSEGFRLMGSPVQDADFRRRAADVHGDNVLQAVQLREKYAGMNSENGAGLDRVDRFGLSDARDAAIDVADEKSSRILRSLAQLVFRLEERSRQSTVRICIDHGAVGSGAVVGALRNIAARENRNRAEEMIGILQIDRRFHFELCGWISLAVFQADADAADAAFEKGARGVGGMGAIECAIDANDVFFGEEAVQDELRESAP